MEGCGCERAGGCRRRDAAGGGGACRFTSSGDRPALAKPCSLALLASPRPLTCDLTTSTNTPHGSASTAATLAARGHTAGRVLGLHVPMAVPLHRARAVAEGRRVPVQCAGDVSVDMLLEDLLHRPRTHPERLAGTGAHPWTGSPTVCCRSLCSKQQMVQKM